MQSVMQQVLQTCMLSYSRCAVYDSLVDGVPNAGWEHAPLVDRHRTSAPAILERTGPLS